MDSSTKEEGCGQILLEIYFFQGNFLELDIFSFTLKIDEKFQLIILVDKTVFFLQASSFFVQSITTIFHNYYSLLRLMCSVIENI